jgi:transcriptional regulator with XRE-family HTH domain
MKPEVSDAVAWYVREVLSKWMEDHPNETKASLARTMDVTKMTTGKILNGEARPGLAASQKTAELVGMDWKRFQALAATEYRARGEREMRTEMDDRYPNRAAVLKVLAAELHPETVVRAKKIALKSVSDMMASEWIDDIRALDRQVRRELANPDHAKREREAKRKEVEAALEEEDTDRPR